MKVSLKKDRQRNAFSNLVAHISRLVRKDSCCYWNLLNKLMSLLSSKLPRKKRFAIRLKLSILTMLNYQQILSVIVLLPLTK